MKVYLSGPITDVDGWFARFMEAAFELRMRGFDVINPAEINSCVVARDGTMVAEQSWEQCMRADIRELMLCDAIAVMPKWEQSRGACEEVRLSLLVGIKFHTLQDLLTEAV